MYLKHITLVLLASALVRDALAAKILAIMLVPSPSHHLWHSRYLEALLRRGHSITYVGLEKLPGEHQNLRHVTFSSLRQDLFDTEFMSSYAGVGPIGATLLLDKWDSATSNYLKKSEVFKEFRKIIESESFDLVVHDIVVSLFTLGAVDVLKNPPIVGITPFGRPSWVLDMLKNPVLYPSHPHSLLAYTDDMTFFERVGNYLFHVFSWTTRSIYMVEQNKHAKDAFGQGTRPLEEIMEKMSIVMVNANDAFDYAYPKVPGLIHVGGLHIDPPKALPKDLKDYLDGAKHGVIYFSLGTNIPSSGLPKEKIDVIADALRQLSPIKVLWKWERADFPGKSDNIKLVKWAPQNDILAHPNILLFFTHSGLLSVQEAIYHGVPILGMPFLLDQHVNLRRCRERGIAEELDYTSLTAEDIVAKVRTIVGDPKYKINAKRLSTIFRDSMSTPRDRAVFWTEYAIRHGGAPHLSLQARRMAWYENYQLDVYLFLLLVLVYIAYVALKILQLIARKLRKDDGPKPKSS